MRPAARAQILAKEFNPFAELLLLMRKEEITAFKARAETLGSAGLAQLLEDELAERALPPLYPAYNAQPFPYAGTQPLAAE